jgi:hypothetical protein
MAHESFSREEALTPSSNRSFGLVMAGAFVLIAMVPWFFGGIFRLWALAIGAAFLVPALVAPGILAPLNRAWLRFGLFLHRIVSPLVLGIMFFLVITPMALIIRMLGKDLLRLRWDKPAPTYWIERTPPGPPHDSFHNQF